MREMTGTCPFTPFHLAALKDTAASQHPDAGRKAFEGHSVCCSASETANSTDDDASREDLKRDLLLAHTLSLLTQQHGSVPPHALPALATYLTEKGLMPRWVQV